MKKPNTLNLKSYATIAGAFLITSQAIDAQVSYEDLEPDVWLEYGYWSPTAYDLDLNDDGINDFRINVKTSASSVFVMNWIRPLGSQNYVSASPYGPIDNCGGSFGQKHEVIAKEAGEVIGASGLWADKPAFFKNNYCDVPGWDDDVHFAGLKFSVAGQTHYGWVRIRLQREEYLTVIDYAYEASSSTPITISAPLLECEAPTNTTTPIASTNYAKLSWERSTMAQSYEIKGRKVPGSFQILPVTGSSYLVNGKSFSHQIHSLKPGKTYEWKVRADCGAGDVSPWTALNTFTTPTMRNTAGQELSGLAELNVSQSGETIQLQFSDQMAEPVSIHIFDLAGRMVHQETVQSTIGLNKSVVKSELLEEGVYILTIKSSLGKLSKKFFYQR